MPRDPHSLIWSRNDVAGNISGQFKSEVHHLEGCSRGTHRDSLMFTTTKRHPYELLPA
jgi:hypothetical protein